MQNIFAFFCKPSIIDLCSTAQALAGQIRRLEYIMELALSRLPTASVKPCQAEPIFGGLYVAAPLIEFVVRVTQPYGHRIEYRTLSSNSLAAFESALEIYGITRIVVSPALKRIK